MNSQPEKAVNLRPAKTHCYAAELLRDFVGAGRRLFLAANSFAFWSFFCFACYYAPEFREEAVRYWLSSGQTLKQVASDLGVSPECLRLWQRQVNSAGQGRPQIWLCSENAGAPRRAHRPAPNSRAPKAKARDDLRLRLFSRVSGAPISPPAPVMNSCMKWKG